MPKYGSWDEVLSAFRALGGIADNVTFEEVNGRRGVHVIDPSQPYKLYIPERLIISVDDVEQRDKQLFIKEGADVDSEARAFFESYSAFTSWSDGGRDGIEALLTGLHKLPEPVKDALKKEFYFSDELERPTDYSVLDRFISTRQTTFKDQKVLFPLLELVNHAGIKSTFVNEEQGISLKGTSESEVLARYGLSDSWTRYKSYGFAVRERWAFSDPFNVSPKDGSFEIIVRNIPEELVVLENGLIAPVVKKEGQTVDISFMLIGDRGDPSVPMYIFQQYVQPHLGPGSAEFFETLSFLNRNKFLELLRLCDAFDGPTITEMKKACHYQLEALNQIWFGSWLAGE